MYADVVDLQEFYISPLGRAVRKTLRTHVKALWPTCRGDHILALGHGTPLLRPLLHEAASVVAFMPAAQGVMYWPKEGPNVSCLADATNLPLPDSSVDRAILIHALEGSNEPRLVLNEVWRVLKSGGRMLLVVPNRRGLWAHSDRTPFGTGQPYSAFQIRETLRDQGFLTDRLWQALYMPPQASRFNLSMPDTFEKWGSRIFPGLGGLLMMEASKQLYAPSLKKSMSHPHRLILPLASAGPVPAVSRSPVFRS